jgi:fibronectin type 3 domain-containing protein
MKEKTATLLSIIFCLIAAAIIVSFINFADAAEVKLAWDANSESDLAGYKVYQSAYEDMTIPTVSNVPLSTLPNQAAPTFTVTENTDGTYYFQVTAYDTANNESGFSNKVSKVVNANPPAPPQNLR